ncbi:NAD(P)-dependent oxidoreductase [Zavarzinia compransoris]|uniref:Dihydrofolate reductase n=1 Tax=Zavarzinia compransoris TaxID=1264899 RepID=A0A317DWD5_9PROT|nr:NAD(P)-dependent oxidoreductase [Zavarzinia compransoris]PWR18270.1 dihydrofolate reductase [Zavarzinia compransoris]TDP43674.1 phosphoglycerate dehydrogenase-like enzyme [Zavarzinia compransoris]
MTDRPIILAHQLSEAFAPLIEQGLPAGVRAVRLAPEAAWAIPPEADVFLALPAGTAAFRTPAEPPPGWPFNIRWVQAIGTGIDDYPRWLFDVPQATSARGATSVQIAEFVIASLLAVEKALPGLWIDKAADWRYRPLGTLDGKTLGLIGFGSIGRAVAVRALPFGLRVLASRRGPQGPDLDGVIAADLDTVLAEADHLVIAAPLTAETRGLLDAGRLARTRPGVHIVNVARGAIIDQEALVAALDSGQVGFASLDVTEPEPLPAGHPLYAHPKVHLSPHLSWAGTAVPLSGVRDILAENLRRFRAGRPLINPIDRAAGY